VYASLKAKTKLHNLFLNTRDCENLIS